MSLNDFESPPFDGGTSGATSGAGTATLESPADSRNKFTAGASGATLGMSAAAYDRITDVAEWTRGMGHLIFKSAMFGAINAEQGAVIAFDCYVRRMPPLTWANTYHMIASKMTMRADAMLARFREAGGKVQWIDTGDDGQKATAKFTVEGKSYSIGYTIEDAQRAGLVSKSGSNWQKLPGEMLRARLTSKAIRMLMPEVISGVYCPEELLDEANCNQTGSASRIVPMQENLVPVENTENTVRITPPKAEAKSAPAQTPGTQPQQNGHPHPVVVVPVDSATSAPAALATSPAPAASTTPATTAAAPQKALQQQLAKIRELKELLGMPDDKYKAIIAKRGVTTARDMTIEQAKELISKLDQLLSDRMAKAKADGTMGTLDTRELTERHGMTPEQAQAGAELTSWANGAMNPNPDRQRTATAAS